MTTRSRKSRLLHAVGGVVLTVALLVLGSSRTTAQLNPRPPGTDQPLVAAPYGTGKLAVAVVLGATGTTGTDAMGPYEAFAHSPRFTVFTVAERRTVAPVEGGPGIFPARTFDEVTPAADVVVVPALNEAEAPAEKPLRDFVRAQAQAGAMVLGVCHGARVLAAAGLLDGREATSHWSRLAQLERDHPKVDWVANRRYVDAGAITTTAGITSGIAGALHLVDRLAGPAEAERVEREVGYPGWSPQASTRLPDRSFGLKDAPVLLSAAVPWGRPTVGIELRDGVGETDVAAAFEVHTVASDARAVGLAHRGWVTTRHGMVLVVGHPRHLDRRATLPVTGNGPGFQGALDRLSRTAGTAAARSAAKMVDYPYEPGGGSTVHWDGARATVLAATVLLLLLVLVVAPPRVRRRRSGRSGRKAAQPRATSAVSRRAGRDGSR
ncbi:MAG: DJ-1/PfpI family protein [Nocardioidaceae bacterium]